MYKLLPKKIKSMIEMKEKNVLDTYEFKLQMPKNAK